MYPITFQIAGLVLIVLVFAMMGKQQTLRLYSESAYMLLLTAVFCSIFLDILSVIGIMQVENIGVTIRNLICKLYLFSIVIVAYFLLGYVLAEVHKTIPGIWKNLVLNIPFILVELFVLLTTEIKVYLQDAKLYTYGACVEITYGIAIAYLCVCVYYLVRNRKMMLKGRLQSICFLLVSWLLAAGIQFLWNQILVVGYAMAFAMVVMYLALEDPQNNIDRVADTFNGHALGTYLDKIEHAGKSFRMITVELGGMRFIVENFGILNGNKILKMTGDYFRELTGEKVFHTSENEFTIVLDEANDLENILEQINHRFHRPWTIREVNFSLDAYIVVLPDNSLLESQEDPMETIHYFMLECRKYTRGATLKIDDKAVESKNKVAEAEKALRWAIQNDKVQVYYQPIYSVVEGKFNSMEALVRISDEESNFVMPDLFIPIAENNGLILELGIIVFRKVCQFLHKSHLENMGIEYVEVNLSVVQCMQTELAQQLLEIMGEYQIPPHRINFEITETAAANSERTLLRNMDNLCSVGSNFSLDDYGSGYSNLSYVVELPINIVKLDKSMVWSYFYSEKAKVAVKSIIHMVHELEMRVVAEGVETNEQFLALKDLGIDYIQGFYFSKPIPGDEIEEFLNKWL